MSAPATDAPVTGMRFGIKDQQSLLEHVFKKCSVRLGTKAEYKNRKQLLETIEASVQAGKFSPRTVGFLCSSKGQGVARYVPVLDAWTTIVYFACVRAIDEACAAVAVDGTFGGWSLGGKRRTSEEAQVRQLIDSEGVQTTAAATAAVQTPADDTAPEEVAEEEVSPDDPEIDIDISTPPSPYNKLAWLENWQEFWKVLALRTEQLSADHLYVSFDIANYYDTLDLTLLENRLRATCPEESEAVNVLFDLLRSWNRALRGYQETSKGIPMDMVGDMSRVLANFNLVGFDADFRADVEAAGGSFLRWADDMFFTCTSRDLMIPLVYKASNRLHSLGLNINASKVRVRTKEEFLAAWRFDILDKLSSEDTASEGMELLQASWNDGNYERKNTALKRSLTVLKGLPDLVEQRKWACGAALQDPEFCLALSSGQLQSMITCSDNPPSAIAAISFHVMQCPFTQTKAEWLRCLERQRKNAESAYGDYYRQVRETMLGSGHPIMVLAAQNSDAP